MNRTSLRLAAVVAGLTITTAACSSGSSNNAANEQPSTGTTTGAAGTKGAAAVTAPASELRAGLTYLLTEHVYLAGIATGTAVKEKGDLTKADVKAAVKALDDNSVALSKAVGSAYPAAE